MVEYVTTNIRLPKEMYDRLKRVALEEGKSLAQIVRESLVEYLVVPKRILGAGDADELDDPIFHIAELTRPEEVIGGDRPTDTSVRHDFYIYGADLDEIPALGDIYE